MAEEPVIHAEMSDIWMTWPKSDMQKRIGIQPYMPARELARQTGNLLIDDPLHMPVVQ